MPTLLIKNGFKFFFYANDHEPMHIHVAKAGGYAKIDLVSLKVSQNYLKSKELKKALLIVKEHRETFKRKWNEYFKR